MAKTTRLNLPFALESGYIKLDSGAQRILDRYNILDLFWNYFPYHIIIIIRINNPIEILKIQSNEIRDRSGQIFLSQVWFLIFLRSNKGLLNFPRGLWLVPLKHQIDLIEWNKNKKKKKSVLLTWVLQIIACVQSVQSSLGWVWILVDLDLNPSLKAPKSNVFYYRIIMFCIYPFFLKWWRGIDRGILFSVTMINWE